MERKRKRQILLTRIFLGDNITLFLNNRRMREIKIIIDKGVPNRFINKGREKNRAIGDVVKPLRKRGMRIRQRVRDSLNTRSHIANEGMKNMWDMTSKKFIYS